MPGPTGAASPVLAPLLREVASAHLFPDSKTIVDMPLRAPPEVVAAAFLAKGLNTSGRTSSIDHREKLLEFISEFFCPVESDLASVDSAALPNSFLEWHAQSIRSSSAQLWARHLHSMWRNLYRKSVEDVSSNPSLHTLLPLPRPFVVPGARFRECYYWDSFWVVRGLIACDLVATAQDIVTNMVYAARTYGFVPNGMRSYYLDRSQPPLLASMVLEIYKATGDARAVHEALPVLVTEHAWWCAAPRGLTIIGSDGTKRSLSRYWADTDSPRVESLREDMATAGHGIDRGAEPSTAGQRELYRDIAAAAESGWDFSSRWLKDGESLGTIHTTQIIPVDLNALLLRSEHVVAELAAVVGEVAISSHFRECAEERREAINHLHWDFQRQKWRDLLIVSSSSHNARNQGLCGGTGDVTVRATFPGEPHASFAYASEWIPLWCGCALQGTDQAEQAVESLENSGLLQQAGIAASTCKTGQQWDWPNAWPPLQAMLAEGCKEYCGEKGEILAEQIAHRYLSTAHTAWKQTGRMFEKFDATLVGAPGGGGEYACVDGFGWTNGLALVWLQEYDVELI